jgi:uncharacterized membrane protein YcfT
MTSSNNPPDRTRWRRLGVNWALALLTAPGAALVMIFAIGAVMSVAACSTVECPHLGPSGALYNVLYYGAPVVAGLTILVSFVTAKRRWGIAVPLSGLGLLLADVAVLAITFNL